MYVVELSLRLTALPVAVQRKDLAAAQSLYQELRQAMEAGHPKLLELTCEKDEHKRISLLCTEVVAMQLYEKSAIGASGKRPGFSLDG